MIGCDTDTGGPSITANLVSANGGRGIALDDCAQRPRVADNGVGVANPPMAAPAGAPPVEALSILPVPTALVFTRRLHPSLVLAIGVWVPHFVSRDAFVTRDLSGTDPGTGNVLNMRGNLDLSEPIAEYHVGPAIGWQVTPQLRLGMSLMVVYHDVNASRQTWLRVAGTGSSESFRRVLFAQEKAVASRFGIRTSFGLQWALPVGLHLGLTIHTPTFSLAAIGQSIKLSIVGELDGDAPPQLDLVGADGEADDKLFEMVQPAELHFGVAWRFAWGWIGVEGEVVLSLETDVGDRNPTTSWNVRVGSRIRVSNKVDIGVGLFTDNGPADTPDQLGLERIDYYGLTAGVEIRSALPLGGNRTRDKLVFSTALAVRYAVGIGEIGAIRFDPFAALGEQNSFPHQRPAVFHELSLHVGSSVRF